MKVFNCLKIYSGNFFFENVYFQVQCEREVGMNDYKVDKDI